MNDLKVECYAGFKYPEKPRAFTYLNRVYVVSEILSFQEEERERKRFLSFKVRTEEGEIFTLLYDLQSKGWSLK